MEKSIDERHGLLHFWFQLIKIQNKTKTANECTREHITKGTLDRFTLPSNSRLTQFIVFCGRADDGLALCFDKESARDNNTLKAERNEIWLTFGSLTECTFGRGNRWVYFGLRAFTHVSVEAVCVSANELILMELWDSFGNIKIE